MSILLNINSMSLYVFNSIAADPESTIPTQLNVSLNNNGVNVTQLGIQAKAVLFNLEETLNNATVNLNLNAGSNTTFVTIDTAYNGKIIAVQLNSGASYIFNINTGVIDQAGIFNNFNSVSTEKLRKWNLGYGGDLGINTFTNASSISLLSILHPNQ